MNDSQERNVDYYFSCKLRNKKIIYKRLWSIVYVTLCNIWKQLLRKNLKNHPKYWKYQRYEQNNWRGTDRWLYHLK